MRLTRSASAFVAGVVATVLTVGHVDAQSRGEVEGLLDQGHQAFVTGDLDGAKAAFEQALTLDITADEALQFLEKYGYHKILKMSRDEDLAKALRRVTELVHTETRKRARDEQAITEKLNEYFSTSDVAEEMKLRYSLANEYGFYLAPGLAERVGDPDLTVRVKAIHGFKALGDDGVMPLIALLGAEEGSTVLGAIAALKTIKNTAAIPTLKRVSETHGDPMVQNAAKDAIASLNPAAAGAPAYDLLVDQAERFYLNSRYLNRTHHDPVVWMLNDGALSYKDVHSWALNELRAEQLLEDAISLPGDEIEARVLHASASIAQWEEYAAVRERAQDEASQGDLRAEEPQMRRIRNRSNMESDQAISGVLARAMADGRPLVAIGAISVMKERFPEGVRASSIDAILASAQGYPHRGVRFAASECLAYMNPESSFSSADLVVTNLTEGLGEAGGRVALTVFMDQNDENNAREKLRLSNVAAFNVKNGLDALERATNYPTDLIILSTSIEGMSTGDLIARLRKDSRTANTPILVVADASAISQAEAQYGGLADSGVSVISRAIEPLRLRDEVIAPLFGTDARSRDIEIAARAAEAIEFLARRNTIFDVSAASDTLVAILENRTDNVRIPACGAIGVMGVKGAESALITICEQGDANSVDVRVAAIDALGKINRDAGSENPALIQVCKAALESGEPRLERAAANAVGNAGIKPALFRD